MSDSNGGVSRRGDVPPIDLRTRPEREGAPGAAPETSSSAAASQHAQAHAVDRLNGEDGAMADPSVLIRLTGGINLPGGIPTVDSSVAGVANIMDGLRPSTAHGGLQVRATVRADDSNRPDENAATVTVSVQVGATAATEFSNLGQMAQVLRDGSAVHEQTRAIYEQTAEAMRFLGGPEVTRLRELAVKAVSSGGLTRSEQKEALRLGTEVGTHLDEALQILGDLPALFDSLEGLVTSMGNGAMAARAGVVANASAQYGVGFRTPSAQVGNHRFDAAGQMHMIQPMPMPHQANEILEDWITLQSSMVAVRAYVDVTVHGLSELSAVIDQTRQTLDSVEDLVAAGRRAGGEIAFRGAASRATMNDAETALQDCVRRGDELRSRVGDLVDAFDIEVAAGLEVEQATGFGVGIEEVSGRWRWDPSASFQLAVRGYVRHLAGYLEGESQHFRVDPNTGDLSSDGAQSANVYQTFFPRIFGLDVGVSMARDSNFRADVLAGVATTGDMTAAHVGYVQQLGQRVVLRMGLIDPDVTRRENHVLMPTAGIDVNIGRRAVPDNVTLGLNGGAAVSFGEGQSTVLQGGQAGVNLTIRLGRGRRGGRRGRGGRRVPKG